MKPKNIVVTGGNSGIGFETVKALYDQGHNVIFGSRSAAKNQEAVTEISKQKGGSVIAFALDLSQRKSIEEFVKNVKSKFDHIDILVNNAGLYINGQKQMSQLGYQMTVTINHFGPFYLTYLLWDIVIKSSEARVINVSSQMSYRAPSNYLQDIPCNTKYSAMDQYSNSKLYNVLFTRGLFDLITKHNLKNVKTAVLHPGFVDTNFGSDSCLFKFIKCLCCCIVLDQNRGSMTSLHLCTTPFAQIRNGQFYNDDTRWKQMDPRGRNAQDVKKLWDVSQQAYGVKFQ